MANFAFDGQRNGFWGTGTQIDYLADTIKAMFVDGADDTPLVADASIADIASAGRVPAIASCPALASVTVGSVGVGVLDAADTTFTSLTGDPSEFLILFKDTGTEATSLLGLKWDVTITPNGGNVTVAWAAGGIAAIA